MKTRLGFALCGSHCNFENALNAMRELKSLYEIIPIMSFNAAQNDTRFGAVTEIRQRIEEISGNGIIDSIVKAEPIGPKNLLDVLLVAPCTGTTLAKLSAGISDTPVTMAVKSHLRSGKPVVVALSTNDALSASAVNIGTLLNRRGYYFVPFYQDDYINKPSSLTCRWDKCADTAAEALCGRQLQPIIG